MKSFIQFIEGFVYDMSKRKKTGSFNPTKEVDPHPHFIKHYAASLQLHKLNKTAGFNDKFDIERELAHSNQKMKHWSSKKNFDYNQVSKQMQQLKNHFK